MAALSATRKTKKICMNLINKISSKTKVSLVNNGLKRRNICFRNLVWNHYCLRITLDFDHHNISIKT